MIYQSHTISHTDKHGRVFTPYDSEDRGYPNTEASNAVRFASLDDLKLRTGLSHIGISGVRVEVILDGVRV